MIYYLSVEVGAADWLTDLWKPIVTDVVDWEWAWQPSGMTQLPGGEGRATCNAEKSQSWAGEQKLARWSILNTRHYYHYDGQWRPVKIKTSQFPWVVFSLYLTLMVYVWISDSVASSFLWSSHLQFTSSEDIVKCWERGKKISLCC